MALAIGLTGLAAAVSPTASLAFGVADFRAETLKADGTTLDTQAGGHPYVGVTSFTLNTTGGLPDGDLKEHPRRHPAGPDPQPGGRPDVHRGDPRALPAEHAGRDHRDRRRRAAARRSPSRSRRCPSTTWSPRPGRCRTSRSRSRPSSPAWTSSAASATPTTTASSSRSATSTRTPSIISTKLTFFGVPADHGTGAPRKPFLTNPTVCGPPYTTRLTVEYHAGDTTGVGHHADRARPAATTSRSTRRST